MEQLNGAAGRAVAAAAAGPYLTFVLGGDSYAIGILSIREILEHGPTTRVPMMPGFVRGVINLRGSVVPVIDLAVRFGNEPTTVGRRTCVVIVEVPCGDERQVMGILVDAVNEVLDIDDGDIEPAPAFGTHLRPEFLSGMGRLGEKFVILLDPARVLAMDEMAALAGAAAATSEGSERDAGSANGG